MSDENKTDPIPEMASRGGKARAASMTPQERSESAKRAADTRWSVNLPKATYGSADRPLRVGGVEIPCYVLEDGRRVITNRGIQASLGLAMSGGAQRTADLVANLERKGVDCKGLLASIQNPIQFRASGGGLRAFGFEATVLADLCDAVLAARELDVLNHQQRAMAAQCEVLVRAFARVGIVALVDEVTGYQLARTRDELQKLLERYVSKELARWQPTFDPDFYKYMFKLRGWTYEPGTGRGPRYVAQLTVDLVYDRIHPDLLKELKQNRTGWEKSGGRKGGKLHQFLTPVEGHPRLKQHLEGVVMALRLAVRYGHTWEQFYESLDQDYPKFGTTPSLPFCDENSEA